MSQLSAAMIDALLAVGGSRAVTAREIGVNGVLLSRLADSGFLIADRDGRPPIYGLSRAGRALVEMLNSPPVPIDREAPIARIQREVAAHFRIPLIEMTSARRARDVARPRQVAMYIAKEITPKSMPDIGRRFGGRDHTTVIHAVRKIKSLMAESPAFFREVETLKSALLADA